MSSNGHNGSGRPINFVRPTCKHTDGPYHDCAYVDRVNALIPEAVKHANRVVGLMPESHDDDTVSKFYKQWNAAYHGEMRRLAKERGVRGVARQPVHETIEPEYGSGWDPAAAMEFDEEDDQ